MDTRSPKHDHIKASETFDVVAKALPDLALQAMSIHGSRHRATPDCESEPGAIQFVGTDNDSQHLRVQAGAPGEYGREIPSLPEPTSPPQATIGAIEVRQRAVCVPSHAARRVSAAPPW